MTDTRPIDLSGVGHYQIQFLERSVKAREAYDADDLKRSLLQKEHDEDSVAYKVGAQSLTDLGVIKLRIKMMTETDEMMATVDQVTEWHLKDDEELSTEQVKDFLTRFGIQRALPIVVSALADLARAVDATPAGPPADFEDEIKRMIADYNSSPDKPAPDEDEYHTSSN